jgi:hypothetical protein
MLILKKEHLTLEGIKKLVSIKSSMNLGLSPELKTIFSNIEPEKNKKQKKKRIFLTIKYQILIEWQVFFGRGLFYS